jgi:hypothetical protein
MKALPWIAAIVGGGIGAYVAFGTQLTDSSDDGHIFKFIPDRQPWNWMTRGGVVVAAAVLAGKVVHMATGGKLPQGVKV